MQTTLTQETTQTHELDFHLTPETRTAPDSLRVLKIQRTCVHDGPGIRTTIFFQGCNLRCAWCQNPESQPLHFAADSGAGYTVDEIMDVVSRDSDYYGTTGGGVTLSGGDPLLQDADSLVRLLKLLKKKKIHIAAETSLHVPWKNIRKTAQYIDLFYVDLKVVGDDELHKKLTNHDATIIRENLLKLVDTGANIRFRMVMVPGFNDNENLLRATAALLKSVGHDSIELLKYHSMYEEKARRLGLERESLNITHEQSVDSVKSAIIAFKKNGISAVCHELESSRNKAVFSQRVYDIQNAIRESDHHLCFESSRLKTQFYRKNGFKKPVHIHRAERLAHVLNNKQIAVYPDELLVGNFTSKRKGGQVWEEHYGILFASILHQINRQKPVSFKCSLRDRLYFYLRIFPFWARHSLMSRVNRSLSELVLMVARSSEMNAGFNNNMAAIAHFIVNFERVLELGTTGIIDEIRKAQRDHPENNHDFYNAAVIALEALASFADRYAGRLAVMAGQEKDPERARELREMAGICRRVPRHPARTFHEALQSMMLLHVALCNESYENAVSFGRLDQILYPYYQRDLEAGIITYEKAKELVALFIIKMDEVILVNDGDTYLGIGRLFETMSTDQTVTVGGLGKDGKDATNDVTYMLLDVCELQPYAVNMTARIHEKSPEEYKDRLAEIYINGAPMPALYNDALYIDTLQRHYPTSVENARNYSIVGCVEPNASDDHYGNTDCANMNVALPFLQALKGQEQDLWNFGFAAQLGKMFTKFVEYNFRRNNRFSKFVLSKYTRARMKRMLKKESPRYNPPANMDELLARFQIRLNRLAASILADHQKIEKNIRERFTTPLASSLFNGCVKSGKDVNEGGATFNSSGIQGVGITDVADSLHAIDEVVYRKKLFTLDDVIAAIDSDFVGDEHRRVREALLAVPKFGHDHSPEAVEWVNRVLKIYVNALNSVDGCPRDGIYAAGYYALNVSDVYGAKTPSLPSGRPRGISLANSIAPHHGMETGDLLSSLNSVAGVDFAQYAPNGTTVTFTIDSALFPGTDGVRNLAGIIDTFFKKGGMQFQPNVINREILLDAYRNPEKHKYLLVRVAGYCAYFNDLSDELKKIIINRTCYS